MEAPKKKAQAYLLVLDSSKMTLNWKAYQRNELPMAAEEYAKAEKENTGKPEIQTVLVSVDSVKDLFRAYPNYSFDTAFFIETVKEAIKVEPSS